MEFRVAQGLTSSGLEFRIQDSESLGFRLVGLGLAVGSAGFVVVRDVHQVRSRHDFNKYMNQIFNIICSFICMHAHTHTCTVF